MTTAPPRITIALSDAPDWTLLPGETSASDRIRAEAALFELSHHVAPSAVIGRRIGNGEDGPAVRRALAVDATRRRDVRRMHLAAQATRSALVRRLMAALVVFATLAIVYGLTR